MCLKAYGELPDNVKIETTVAAEDQMGDIEFEFQDDGDDSDDDDSGASDIDGI